MPHRRLAFDEAFSAWRDSEPCYPADTLSWAASMRLPTDGKSDRRFTPAAARVGAEQVGAARPDVWEAMTQAQRDDWNLRRTDRRT